MTNNTINVPRELLENIVLCYNEGEFELGTLAAECHAILSAPSPAGVDGLEVVGYLLTKGNQLSRMPAGAADEPLCRLSDAQAIIDGLRGEVARMSKEKSARQALSISLIDEARALRTERDQQAQRIGELEGLLLACHSTLYPFDNKVLEAEIDAACLPARSWSDG